jgi:hypothetical protein
MQNNMKVFGLISILLSGCSAVDSNHKPVIPQHLASATYLLKLDLAGEWEHGESYVIARVEGDVFAYLFKRDKGCWLRVEICERDFDNLHRKIERNRFFQMKPFSQPYALGGISYAINIRDGDVQHAVYRVNPDESKDESKFTIIVRGILEVFEQSMASSTLECHRL